MQLTIAEAIAKHEELKALEAKAFPVGVSYAISVNLDQLKNIAERFEQKRLEAVKRLAEKGENGEPIIEENHYKIPTEKMALLNGEISEFMRESVDVAVRKIRIEALDPCDSSDRFSSVTPAELRALDFMIDKPGEAEGAA